MVLTDVSKTERETIFKLQSDVRRRAMQGITVQEYRIVLDVLQRMMKNLEVPGKQLLSGTDWLTVQHSFYGGFAVVGAVAEVLGLLSIGMVLYLLRERRGAFALTLVLSGGLSRRIPALQQLDAAGGSALALPRWPGLADANCHVSDPGVARLPFAPACRRRKRIAHHRGGRVPCTPGERLHCSVPCEHILVGKVLRLVGRIAGCRSDCAGDLPAPGRTTESLIALRSGLLRGPRLSAASGSVRSCCGQVVGGPRLQSCGSGNEGQVRAG